MGTVTTTAPGTSTTTSQLTVSTLTHSNELMLLIFLVGGMLVAGLIVIVGRKVLSSGPSSDPVGSLIRSWVAISLVLGLLIFGAAALLISDSTLRSTLFGGLIASVASAVAYYFSSQGAGDALAAATSINQTPIAPTAFSADSPGIPKLNSAYAYTFTANGAPTPTYSLAAGALPDGLVLTADGKLAGTTTSTGAESFTVRAINVAGHVDSRQITLTPVAD